jgi:hypothetical protein
MLKMKRNIILSIFLEEIAKKILDERDAGMLWFRHAPKLGLKMTAVTRNVRCCPLRLPHPPQREVDTATILEEGRGARQYAVDAMITKARGATHDKHVT